jgi:hypothetical protein
MLMLLLTVALGSVALTFHFTKEHYQSQAEDARYKMLATICAETAAGPDNFVTYGEGVACIERALGSEYWP